MSEPTATTEPKRRTIDIGVATVIAAGITAVGAITTAILSTELSRGPVAGPEPAATVTVTATPGPVVTVVVSPAAHHIGAAAGAAPGITEVVVAGAVTVVAAFAFIVLALRWLAGMRRVRAARQWAELNRSLQDDKA